MSEKENWTLRDVLFEIAKGYKHVRAIVRECTPESAQIVEAEEISKTEKGFLINLSTYLSNVADLAAAWHGKREISIRGWLLTNKQIKNPTNRILLMQGNERYRQLEKAYIQAIMEVVGATVSSPTMTESRTRRIWFAFDEIVQAGKIPTLTKMLEVGRSKGIRMIIGAQDLGQIREEYGNNIAEIWTSNISTYFLGSTGRLKLPNFWQNFAESRKSESTLQAMQAAEWQAAQQSSGRIRGKNQKNGSSVQTSFQNSATKKRRKALKCCCLPAAEMSTKCCGPG
jgi:hypothetical protein